MDELKFALSDFWQELGVATKKASAQLLDIRLSQPFYKIHEIHDTKIHAYMPKVRKGEFYAIVAEDEQQLMLAEVAKIEADNFVTLFPLGSTNKLSLHCKIMPLAISYTLSVGSYLKGKVLDGYGKIIHEFNSTLSNMADQAELALDGELVVPVAFKRKIISQQFITGVRAIDMMTPFGVGQRVLICAQPGVGKTTLINLIAQSANMDIIVINLIGERGREINEFFESLAEEIKQKTIFIVSTADKPYLEQVKSLYTAHMIAAWFRGHGRRVLLLVDSMTRFARALREVSLANGAIVVRNYTNTVFTTLPRILETAGPDEFGSITALYTALFEGESLGNDPLIEEIKSITDGHLVLSRKIANGGRYPAINFLESISRIVAQIASNSHQQLTRRILQIYSAYSEFELLIKLGEYSEGSNHEIDLTISKYKLLNEFFNQSTPGEYRQITQLFAELEQIVNAG